MPTINPYALQFGQEPQQLIPRESQLSEVVANFLSDNGLQHIYMITGIRGSGKTVFMTNVANSFVSKQWIVINVNVSSQISIVEQIVIQLANNKRLKNSFLLSSLSANIFGVDVKVDNAVPTTSAEYEATKLLKSASEKNLKVLITIDEVTSTSSIKEFAGAFQIWLRENLSVYLLMTGLYENIRELQDDKSLTFLYRSPRIDLFPLQMGAIKNNYEENLNITSEQAKEMARYTLGYSFAFQALGYVVWNNGKYDKKALQEYMQILADFSYEKIWSELSDNDRKVCIAIAESSYCEYKEVKSILNWDNNQLNPYRKRLINKQIISDKKRGFMSFTLPLFKEFINDQVEYETW